GRPAQGFPRRDDTGRSHQGDRRDMSVQTATAPAAGNGTGQSVNLRALLDEMIQRNASDLHITAGERPKMRVDGEIVDSAVDTVLGPRDTLAMAYSILTEVQKKRFETED